MADLVPWGYGGVQLAQQYQMNDQLMQMRDLAMQNDQTDLDKKQQDLAIDQKAAQMMSDIAKGNPTKISNPNPDDQVATYADGFRKVGANLMEMGAPNQAMKYFQNAAALQKDEDAVANAQLNRQKGKAELLLKQSDIMARDLGDAQNEEQWNQGLDAMEQSGIFDPAIIQQYRKIPFHPEAAATIKQRALSVKDQAQLDYQQQQEARIQANADRTASIQLQRLAFDKQKEADRKREKDLSAKTGKAATAPNKDELKSAEASVTNLIFNGKIPKQIGDGGEDTSSYRAYQAGVQSIAAQAKQMVRENKGLSWEAAVSRATLASKAAGDWDIQTETHMFSDDETVTSFNGQGKQPEDALPIPMTDNKPDTSSLKKGRWYISPTGKKGKWNGTGFDVMQ